MPQILSIPADRANDKARQRVCVLLGLPITDTLQRIDLELADDHPLPIELFDEHGCRLLVEVNDHGLVLADGAARPETVRGVRFDSGERHTLVPWRRVLRLSARRAEDTEKGIDEAPTC